MTLEGKLLGLVGSLAMAMTLVTGCGFPQPANTVALNFSIDASKRPAGTYKAEDLEWKGSFSFDKVTRLMTYDASWAGGNGPYAPLYDDGPWGMGGHEPDGSTAGDSIFGITAFLPTPAAAEEVQYGAQTKEGGWIWVGTNGSFTVPANATTAITATGMQLSPSGQIDLKLMLNTHALDAAFTPGAITGVKVKGTFSTWGEDTAFDDGTHGDATADDGIYTYTLGLNTPARLKLLTTNVVEFVWVVNGTEYKVGGNPPITGCTAATQAPAGSLTTATITNSATNGNTEITVP